jgi:hypothetical protein
VFKLRAGVGFGQMDHSVFSLHFYLVLDEGKVVRNESYVGVGVGLGICQFEDVFDILYFAHFFKNKL